MNKRLILIAAGLALACAPAFARGGGGHGGGHSSGSRSSSRSSSPGAHTVRSYVTKRGTFVKQHRETKGNVNPDTGKEGTKVTPLGGEPR